MKFSPGTRRKSDGVVTADTRKLSQSGIRLRISSTSSASSSPTTSTTASSTKRRAVDNKIRVLLVDDNMVIRIGLASMLNEHRDIDVIGEASDGQMAVEMVREFHPHVVVMDVNMPRMNGVEATAHITREFPEIRVVAISMHDEQRVGHAMLNAGAAQFLPKDSAPEKLIAAVRGLSV